MSMQRILVCGCRDWSEDGVVFSAISNYILEQEDDEKFIIVHGACPTGADRVASRFALMFGLSTEAHPADWDAHGKAAGPIRNREMAESGVAVCLAFWDGKSRGTLDMIKLATKAGIAVRIYPKAGDA